MDGFYFLANPLSGTSDEKKERFNQTCQALSFLLKKGIYTYSPTIHNNTMLDIVENWTVEDKKTHLMSFSLEMLRKSRGMILLALDGWEKSEGVLKEINFAKENNIPVYKLSFAEVLAESFEWNKY